MVSAPIINVAECAQNEPHLYNIRLFCRCMHRIKKRAQNFDETHIQIRLRAHPNADLLHEQTTRIWTITQQQQQKAILNS